MPIIVAGHGGLGAGLGALGQGAQAGFSMGQAKRRLDLVEQEQQQRAMREEQEFAMRQQKFEMEKSMLEQAQAERTAERQFNALRMYEEETGIPEGLQGEALKQAGQLAGSLGLPIGMAAQLGADLVADATPDQQQLFAAMSPDSQNAWLEERYEQRLLEAEQARIGDAFERAEVYARRGYVDPQMVADAQALIQAGEDPDKALGPIMEEAQRGARRDAWDQASQEVAALGKQVGMYAEELQELVLSVGTGKVSQATAMAALQAGTTDPEDLAVLDRAFQTIKARRAPQQRQPAQAPVDDVVTPGRRPDKQVPTGAGPDAAPAPDRSPVRPLDMILAEKAVETAKAAGRPLVMWGEASKEAKAAFAKEAARALTHPGPGVKASGEALGDEAAGLDAKWALLATNHGIDPSVVTGGDAEAQTEIMGLIDKEVRAAEEKDREVAERIIEEKNNRVLGRMKSDFFWQSNRWSDWQKGKTGREVTAEAWAAHVYEELNGEKLSKQEAKELAAWLRAKGIKLP